MDYEKKYKDALANVRQEYNTTENIERKQWLEELFPELKESDDEMIRKELIRETKGSEERLFEVITNEEFIAWLEKQGEQKQFYIRFGNIPEGEKSSVWRGDEFLGKENGVSVYPAFKHNGNIVLGLSLPITKTTLYTQQHLLEYDNRPCYLVKGDYIGNGADGEPLIRNVEIVEEIKDFRAKEGEARYKIKDSNSLSVNNKPFDYEHATITQKDFAPKDYHNIDPHFGISVEDLMSKKNSADKVKPIFNIGDVLCDKSCTTLDKNSQPNIEILDIRNGMYICNNCTFPIYQQDEYELVTKKIEPQSAWSDEDEGIKENIEGALDCYESMVSEDWEREKEWLNSIKDRLSKVKKC